jgi:hypothetical protein
MGSCAAQTFSDISADKWAALQQQAAQSQIPLNGNTGQVQAKGCTFTWDYDPEAQTLMIQCLDHPWIASCGYINGMIHDLVEGTSNSGSLPS